MPFIWIKQYVSNQEYAESQNESTSQNSGKRIMFYRWMLGKIINQNKMLYFLKQRHQRHVLGNIEFY